jgi:hypothetical protein
MALTTSSPATPPTSEPVMIDARELFLEMAAMARLKMDNSSNLMYTDKLKYMTETSEGIGIWQAAKFLKAKAGL